MKDFRNGVIVGAGFAGLAAAVWFRAQNKDAPLLLLEKEARILPWLDRKGMTRIPAGDIATESGPFESLYPRGVKLAERILQSWPGQSNLDWLQSIGFRVNVDETGTATFKETAAIRDIWRKLLEENRIELKSGFALETLSQQAGGAWRLWSREGEAIEAGAMMLATGGERNHGMALARESGHETNPVEPAYLRLRLASPKLGSALGPVRRKVTLRCTKSATSCTGMLSLSGRGLEGPVVSRLSAHRGRQWRQVGFKFKVEVDWIPDQSPGRIWKDLDRHTVESSRKPIGDDPLFGFSGRQWHYLLSAARIDPSVACGKIKTRTLQSFSQLLKNHTITISGAGLPANERAWAGGLDVSSIDWSSGQSGHVPGLWFAGEVMDILGLPDGPHVNAVWGSAHLAGTSMARAIST